MGAAASKAGRSASARAAKRQYPQRIPTYNNNNNNTRQTTSKPKVATSRSSEPAEGPPPGATQTQSLQEKTSKIEAQVTDSRTGAIEQDAQDPHYAASLRSIGPVQTQPAPNFASFVSSNTSSSPSTITSAQQSTAPGSASVRSPGDVIQTPQATSPYQQVFPGRSAANNPAIALLEARRRLAQEADAEMQEFGRPGGHTGGRGRRFLDVLLVKQVLLMRDVQGKSDIEIESALDIAPGTVTRLGQKKMLAVAT